MAATDFVTESQVDALTTAISTAVAASIASTDVESVVEISQSAYDALGGGRPATTLYLITS